jgi:hypothetical protein
VVEPVRATRFAPWASIVVAAVLVTGCRAVAGPSPSQPASESPAASASSASSAAAGTLDLEQLRQALLGDPPYPSGYEAEVDEMIEMVSDLLDEIRVPDVSSMDAVEGACAVWQPMVGNTGWATGALLERQSFIAHVAALAAIAPVEIRTAAEGALAISTAAAAEQLVSGGDPAIVSRAPDDDVETIGLWAVANCDLPIEADDPPDTDGWTADEIAQSCTWDREWLQDAQEEYRAGPGDGRYAEHPHQLEVTLEIFAYPAWHELVVDNGADPPTFRVEPIRGAFCDV